ncbi:MAG: D-alanyl-D-alanine carboxypeptidase [Alphaproteobacteria bacterium]|nr:D-alanyl-D-alanine carboxypeptidase [Alphaproteobacteria bacterium]
MKKLLVLITGYWLLVTSAHSAEFRAALVADMDTGEVIFQSNADLQTYPASLTKIMTMYLAFDALRAGRLRLDDRLIVSRTAAAAPPVRLGLAAGSTISVDDALRAIAVHSSNDVARALAENLQGGRETSFAQMMTDVARQIGLTQTNFENASGLPNDDHMSSARDMALLAMATWQHFPEFRHYFALRTFTWEGRTHTSGNRLLRYFPGATGMKTGFTNAARFCLVGSAERNGRNLMVVILGSPDRDTRHRVSVRLLNAAFAGEYIPQPTATVPALRTTSPQPQATGPVATGHTGVQFGAFGSRAAADTQITRVRQITGLSAAASQSGNLWRVRASGISEAAAQNACNQFRSAGHECFIFR